MFFLNPTYLWCLLGLLVPIGIHLWNRKEGKTIKIGSIQLLQESTSKQSSSIRLNEFWLLLLRLGLLGLLVLIISEPRIREEQPKEPVTYIIESSLFNDERIRSVLDTLDESITIRLFQSGFPTIELDKESFKEDEKVPNYWQLAQELHELPVDSIIVFTNGYAKGLKGKRPIAYKNVNWVFLDQGESDKNMLKAVESKNKKSAHIVSGDLYTVSFSKESISKRNTRLRLNSTKDSMIFRGKGDRQILPIQKQKETNIGLLYEQDHLNEMKYCKAALQAISEYLGVIINIDTTKNKESIDFSTKDLVIWLHKDPIPQKGSKVIAYRPDSLATSIIQPGLAENSFHITKPLSTERALQQYFSERLIEILDIHQEEKQKAIAYDKRVVPREEFLPIVQATKEKIKTADALNISEILWWILPFLIGVERILAKYRKQ